MKARDRFEARRRLCRYCAAHPVGTAAAKDEFSTCTSIHFATHSSWACYTSWCEAKGASSLAGGPSIFSATFRVPLPDGKVFEIFVVDDLFVVKCGKSSSLVIPLPRSDPASSAFALGRSNNSLDAVSPHVFLLDLSSTRRIGAFFDCYSDLLVRWEGMPSVTALLNCCPISKSHCSPFFHATLAPPGNLKPLSICLPAVSVNLSRWMDSGMVPIPSWVRCYSMPRTRIAAVVSYMLEPSYAAFRSRRSSCRIYVFWFLLHIEIRSSKPRIRMSHGGNRVVNGFM